MTLMKVLVLAGGLSPERNVSLSSGSKIAQALRGLGHQAALVDVFFGLEDYPGLTGADLYTAPLPQRWREVDPAAPDLEQVKATRADQSRSQFGPGVLELCRDADVVFLALHGSNGEDGRIQAAFDLLGVPYTGSDYLGSAIAMDKDLTKQLVRATGVRTPQWVTIPEVTAAMPEAFAQSHPTPVVVKVPSGGSSIGVYVCHDKDALYQAMMENMGRRVIVEQFVKGREFSCGVLDSQALPPIEIIPKAGFYDYANKYQPGATEEICPAHITSEQSAAMMTAALTVHQTLGLTAYSRCDFLMDEAGEVWFLEVNTLPGMTPTSLLPQEAAQVGIDYPTLCQTLLDIAMRERG